MDILQAAAPMLANHDPDIQTYSAEASAQMGIRLIARFPTVVAAWHRIRNGEEPVAPSDELSHAANFLYMMSGEVPDDETARFMDICLILHVSQSPSTILNKIARNRMPFKFLK